MVSWLWLVITLVVGFVSAAYCAAVEKYQSILWIVLILFFIGCGLAVVGGIGYYLFIKPALERERQRIQRREQIVEQKEAKLENDKRVFAQSQKDRAAHVFHIGSQFIIETTEAEQKSALSRQIREVQLAFEEKYNELIEGQNKELNRLRIVVREQAEEIKKKMYSAGVKPRKDMQCELLIEGPAIKRRKH